MYRLMDGRRPAHKIGDEIRMEVKQTQIYRGGRWHRQSKDREKGMWLMISERARAVISAVVYVRVPELINQRIFQTGLFLNIHTYKFVALYLPPPYHQKFWYCDGEIAQMGRKDNKMVIAGARAFYIRKTLAYQKVSVYADYTERINVLIYCSPIKYFIVYNLVEMFNCP